MDIAKGASSVRADAYRVIGYRVSTGGRHSGQMAKRCRSNFWVEIYGFLKGFPSWVRLFKEEHSEETRNQTRRAWISSKTRLWEVVNEFEAELAELIFLTSILLGEYLPVHSEKIVSCKLRVASNLRFCHGRASDRVGITCRSCQAFDLGVLKIHTWVKEDIIGDEALRAKKDRQITRKKHTQK